MKTTPPNIATDAHIEALAKSYRDEAIALFQESAARGEPDTLLDCLRHYVAAELELHDRWSNDGRMRCEDIERASDWAEWLLEDEDEDELRNAAERKAS